MKYLLHFIVSLIRFAFLSTLLSVILGGIQWLLSLTCLVEAPTWNKILWGGIGLFVLIFVYSAYKAIQASYHSYKDPIFRDMACSTGISWNDYKRLRKEQKTNDRNRAR